VRRLLLLLVAGASAASAAWPEPTIAQVAAPSLVEEDLPPEEPPPRPAGEPVPSPPPALEAAPAAKAAAPKPAPEAGPPVRAIVPVHVRYEDLLRAWHDRRRALREEDVPRARAAEQRVLDMRRELGIENLDDFAAAEIRASARALEARVPADAVAAAELAVALAPDLAAAHVALARARLERDPSQLMPALADLASGVSAAFGEPHTARAFAGDLLVAALSAVAVAAAIVIALLFLRRLRLVLHDFHHLPGVRLATPLQAGFLALVLLALPLAFRLGPAAVLAALALASALYLATGERIVATVALVAVALLPWAAHQAARITAWTGTLAEDVYLLEHGADDGRVAARLAARADRGELPPPALLALGHHHKRRGDLDRALRLYEAAGAERADALVNAGNVHLLKGDADRAKAAYLAAIDRASATGDLTSLAAAHYDLSKIFVRQSALDQAQEARKKAALEDAALLERHGSDEDFGANRWLVDVPVAAAEIRALAADDVPRAVEDAVLARLAGPLPPPLWPWAPLGAAVALWLMGLLRRRVAPSVACERCGRAACARCDGGAGPLCGQCVNVFVKRGVVEPRDRLRKEAQVRRHARARRLVARVLALAGGGHVWRGEPARGALVLLALAFLGAVAVFWRGVVPPPHPAAWVAFGKLAVAASLAVVVWALAVRDVFKRTRS